MRIRVPMSPVDLETHRTQSKLKLLGIAGSPRKQDGSGSNLVYVNDTALYMYIYIYIKGSYISNYKVENANQNKNKQDSHFNRTPLSP